MIQRIDARAVEPGDRRGSAMIASVMSVFAVAAMSAVFLQMSHTITKRQTHSADLKRAMYLAEAGLAESYIGLSMAKTGNVGTAENPAMFGDGLFWVEAESTGDNLVELKSTALAGSARITLGLAVERAEVSVGTLGFYAQENLTVTSGSTIDSYDSADGTYADQAASGENNTSTKLGSGGSVLLNGTAGPVSVQGDVVHGIHDAVVQRGTVSVAGTIQPGVSNLDLPAPQPPAPAMSRPVTHVSPVPLVIPSGTRGLASLTVGPDATAVVVGPASIVTSAVTLGAGATLELDVRGGPIEFFVAGDFLALDGAFVTNSAQDPTQASIQLAEQANGSFGTLSLGAGAEFCGTIYAPNSTVELGDGADVCGAVVAETLTLGQAVQLHFDLAIARDTTTLPRLINWRVLEIPAGLAATSSDPFRLMGVDRNTLQSPSESHEVQWLVIKYIDLRGVETTYAGWERAFDWSDVDEVLEGTRGGTPITEVVEARADAVAEDLAAPSGAPMDWINDPDIGKKELAAYLVEASPLTDAEIMAAVTRSPAMTPEDQYEVIQANIPMEMRTLRAVVEAGAIKDKYIYSVMEAHAPVDDSVLIALIELPGTPNSILREVLVLHSPVSAAVQTALANNADALSDKDNAAFDAAQ